ncbi:MAG TPA: YbdK family carboxylate-amine ligase [Solirubrobacterales bacterium]|nr:YbdK family carboxylate-amine ligase [Solirubrobacterales bacterium]
MTPAPDPSLDLEAARQTFEESRDFTVAIEEEFALLDPETLELAHRFGELYAECERDEVLAESAAGELIDTEIEIRSGKAETFADAVEQQSDRRRRLFALADRLGVSLVAMGTHPWADYLDQEIIDTPHYQRLRHDLGYVAQRNQTWSLHVHVGVRGADRAIAVCDHLRGVLPTLLAASANSPFLDRRDTGLHSVRTQIFTRTFPRCGIHDPFGDWAGYADFIDLLSATGSIVESTQLWWSVRPHHRFGTVEVRICDAQARGEESFRLAGLMIACVAQAALDYDEGALGPLLRAREVEENLWRAIRYGLDGRMIDFADRREVETRAAVDALWAWTEPARRELGIDDPVQGPNGAQRARAAFAEGGSIEEIYRETVADTTRTYVPEPVAG